MKMKKTKKIKIHNIEMGANKPFVFISGPCVIEKKATTIQIARRLKDITSKLNIPFVFKASYDKANRTSINSYRGPGIEKGLDILAEIKDKLNVPVCSDVHNVGEIDRAAGILDILQIPAFLCRQTDLLVCAGSTGKVVNVKKGQFLAPENAKQIIRKIESTGNKKIMLTERGMTFGPSQLVADFTSLKIMRDMGYPVCFDASHSVQRPGGLGNASGGKSEFIPLLARSGVAAGLDALFMEVHTNPKKALSDGPNMLSLSQVPALLKTLRTIDKTVKGY